ncbi:MAG: 2-C-methyl-D-erythritol 4-phosphate cytidylyltransferase [Bacteroidota bacterium]
MKRAVVLVAGGAGSRLGGAIPKQYRELEGKPIIVHTLEKFLLFDPDMEVVVVMAGAHKLLWQGIAETHVSNPGILMATGGLTRFHSVRNGLELIREGRIVGIHDAVRPFVSCDTLERCYSMAEKTGGAIPVTDMDESIRMIAHDHSSVHMDRSMLKRVQTPQVFRSELIKEAYRKADHSDFTDDASVYEAFAGNISLVEGNRQNIKITTPTDMKLASVLIRSAE